MIKVSDIVSKEVTDALQQISEIPVKDIMPKHLIDTLERTSEAMRRFSTSIDFAKIQSAIDTVRPALVALNQNKPLIEAINRMNDFKISIDYSTILGLSSSYEKILRSSIAVMDVRPLALSLTNTPSVLRSINTVQQGFLLDYPNQFKSDYLKSNLPSLNEEEDDQLNGLLDKLNPALRKKRLGAWLAFKSENPDRLSQSANSMVELLSQVLDAVCEGQKLKEYFKKKKGYAGDFSKEEAEWVEITIKWIASTKEKLHRVKHHIDYQSQDMTRVLLNTTEHILLIVLL